MSEPSLEMHFADNQKARALFGPHEQHLAQLARLLNVKIVSRGNRIRITGTPAAREAARAAFACLETRIDNGLDVEADEVAASARVAAESARAQATTEGQAPTSEVITHGLRVRARSQGQREALAALQTAPVTFLAGPAGTGKTRLAVAAAVAALEQGVCKRIVLVRPALEAGEHLGFLPGDLHDKLDPYLRPLYDALAATLAPQVMRRRLEEKSIELAPLAFMRGRTLQNAFVILDEAQNATVGQMKMFLTRFGEGSKMAVAGDLEQIDLPRAEASGLADAIARFAGQPGFATIRLGRDDVVRHEIVARVLDGYQSDPPSHGGRR